MPNKEQEWHSGKLLSYSYLLKSLHYHKIYTLF